VPEGEGEVHWRTQVGAAFLAITAETRAWRYGIELDVYRAERAASVVDELIHRDCLDAQP